MNLSCLSAPLGCGRVITAEEFNRWDDLSKAEFRMSGWCLRCQNSIFDAQGWEDDE